jgi:hypothetical protein
MIVRGQRWAQFQRCILIALVGVSTEITGCAGHMAPIAHGPGMTVQAVTQGNAPCISTSHGCIALNRDVTSATAKQTICVAGYSKRIRPPSHDTEQIKVRLLRAASIEPSRISDFELDHIIPLSLGGHPRDLTNLELQSWAGERGARRKDALERRLHNLVCRDGMSLSDAQACIAEDWYTCASRYLEP